MIERCPGRIPDGGRCPYNAKESVGGVPMCGNHKQLVLAEVAGQDPEVARAVGAVVYYIGDPTSGHVKIGTSTNLQVRMNKLRADRPGTLILATEPGSYAVERKRHNEFAFLLVRESGRGRREWFRNEPALVQHVSVVRQQHGIIAPGRPLWDSYVAPWNPAV